MNDRFWIDVLSGADGSVGGTLLRGLLRLAEPGYAIGSRLRNFAYDSGWLPSHSLGCPVISVGNITTGGTGKTPTVAWLVKLCQSLGVKPGILSRGYRSLDGAANDEKRLLDELCPGIPHVQNRDRVAGGTALLRENACEMVILDDGFQHQRLKRDVNLVLIDALNPWGYGHLLPRGLLRESLSGLSRADLVLITRCDLASLSEVEQIESTLHRWIDLPPLKTKFVPTGLVNRNRDSCTWKEIAGEKVGAFCGIGNPEGFRQTLQSVGIPLEAGQLRSFPDHYHYTEKDIDHMASWAKTNQFHLLLTTRKDLVKIPQTMLGNCPLWGVDIGLKFVDPDSEIVIKNLIGSLQSSVINQLQVR